MTALAVPRWGPFTFGNEWQAVLDPPTSGPSLPYTGAVFRLWSCVVSWSGRFAEPIELPDGRKFKTLAEAMAWLAKEIPKSEHKMEKVQTAAHLVTRAAEHGGPMTFAQMGMLQAIHRHHKRVYTPDRKDTHWGKRKLNRDM